MGKCLSCALVARGFQFISISQMFSTRIGSHSNELALQYFDFAYPLIFHRHWPSIRLALLSVPKPVALLNPFSLVSTDVKDKLIRHGAVDLLRFNNEELRNRHSEVQKRIGQSDSDYAAKKLLEQQERRRLLGTDIPMTDDDDDDDDDDEEEDMKKFNQPEPVQRFEDMLHTALEQQVDSTQESNSYRKKFQRTFILGEICCQGQYYSYC